MHVQVSLTIEIGATASLTEMEQHIQEAGQQGMREALKQAIRQREDQQVSCPHCGQKQRRLEGTVRRVIATVFGRVEVARRRFRCQGCLRRWCPANGLFTELKGGTISQPLQEAARLAGCSWPYRVASQLLKKLSGAQRSRRRDPTVDQSARETASHRKAERKQSESAHPR
jgi:transposase-like protein